MYCKKEKEKSKIKTTINKRRKNYNKCRMDGKKERHNDETA